MLVHLYLDQSIPIAPSHRSKTHCSMPKFRRLSQWKALYMHLQAWAHKTIKDQSKQPFRSRFSSLHKLNNASGISQHCVTIRQPGHWSRHTCFCMQDIVQYLSLWKKLHKVYKCPRRGTVCNKVAYLGFLHLVTARTTQNVESQNNRSAA